MSLFGRNGTFDRTRERLLDAAARVFVRIVPGKPTPPPEPSMEGKKQGESFKDYMTGLRKANPNPPRERSPYGVPGVYEDDAAFIRNAMARSKWEDVEYYGPGAAAAEERRRETLGRMKEREEAALAADRPELEAMAAAVAVDLAGRPAATAPKKPPKASSKKRERMNERIKRLREKLRNAP